MYHEDIELSPRNTIPYKLLINEIKLVPYHWHNFIEIIFVVKGSIRLTVEKEVINLHKDDIFIINTCYRHSIESISDTNIVYAIQIREDFLRDEIDDFEHLSFGVFEHTRDNDKNLFKKYLSELALLDVKKKKNSNILRKILILELLNLMYRRFSIKVKKGVSSEGRILDILLFINENIVENLSLSDIAAEFKMTPSYISRMFKKNTGINIMTYIIEYKLQLACSDLIHTEKKISDIIFERGFNSISSFNEQFKKKYGVVPNIYRKTNRLEHSISKNEREKAIYNYINLMSSDTLSDLFKLKNDKKVVKYIPVSTSYHEELLIDTANSLSDYNTDITKMIGIGRAKDLLDVRIQEQLIQAKNEVGFKHVRFHGIFSDDLMVYCETADRREINFRYIDQIFDFFVENDLIPCIEIGFMPKDLASGRNTMYRWKANTTQPKNMMMWIELIDTFIRHLINRYEKNTIALWDFEIWNEPDLEGYYWQGTQEEYLEFFKLTYETIKKVDSTLKISGFSGTSWSILNTDWTKKALNYLEDNNIILESFTYHIYPIQWNLEATYSELWSGNRKGLYTYADSDYIQMAVREINDIIKGFSCIKQGKTIVTEWNSSSDPRDLLHDTTFMSSFIVKNVISSFENVNMMGFWMLSDIFDEHIVPSELFYGGFGLINVEGLKKPSYFAFSFLNQLGNKLIHKGENIIITKDDYDNFQILIHNYQEYDELYKAFNTSHISNENRYNVFADEQEKYLKVTLQNIYGVFLITTERVNRSYGSVYDNWLNSGGERLNSNYFTYLKNISVPKMNVCKEKINGHYTFQLTLEAHEIMLIKMKRIL